MRLPTALPFASVLFGLYVTAAVTPSLRAQPAVRGPDSVPSVSTTAQGEATVTPDHATVQIAVETRAPSAAAAAAQNADQQQRVIDALKGAGIPAAQIRTVGYRVSPEYAPDTARREPGRVTGYRVSNTVLVEIRQIDQVGRILDVALAAGANRISSLHLSASNVDSARREALRRAVDKARLDAEALARAAGGSLGRLLQLTSVEYHVPLPRPIMMERALAASAAPTPIEPGEYTVSARVTASWRFDASPRAVR